MAQPYRAHAKDLLEPQRFPKLEKWPGGPTERPYDVAGWTLPLQLGVKVVPVDTPVTREGLRALAGRMPAPTREARPMFRADRVRRVALYKPWTGNMDEGWTRWLLEQYKLPFTNV